MLIYCTFCQSNTEWSEKNKTLRDISFFSTALPLPWVIYSGTLDSFQYRHRFLSLQNLWKIFGTDLNADLTRHATVTRCRYATVERDILSLSVTEKIQRQYFLLFFLLFLKRYDADQHRYLFFYLSLTRLSFTMINNVDFSFAYWQMIGKKE